METANAFHMLILPVLQCTAVIFAAFAIIRLVQVASGRLFATEARPVLNRTGHGSAHAHGYRMASSRSDRANAGPVGLSR